MIKRLTSEDFEEIIDLLVGMRNLMFALNLADSIKIDKWNRIRERVAVEAYRLKTKERKRRNNES